MQVSCFRKRFTLGRIDSVEVEKPETVVKLDLSSGQVHCDYGSEAFFGGGTKLTVLGKRNVSFSGNVCQKSFFQGEFGISKYVMSFNVV